jgi:hypothetical protein
MKTERFAMAYRLLLRIRLISVRSLSKIAHIYRLIVTGVVDGACRTSRRSRTYKGSPLRKPPYHYASSPYGAGTFAHFEAKNSVVCTENSDSHVLVMQSAE